MGVKYLHIAGNMVFYHWVLRLSVFPTTSQSSSSIPGMEIVDLLESLQLHNTTYAGLQQKPGPHSHHPAALFSGRHLFPPLAPWTLVLVYSGILVLGYFLFLCQVCHHCSVS